MTTRADVVFPFSKSFGSSSPSSPTQPCHLKPSSRWQPARREAQILNVKAPRSPPGSQLLDTPAQRLVEKKALRTRFVMFPRRQPSGRRVHYEDDLPYERNRSSFNDGYLEDDEPPRRSRRPSYGGGCPEDEPSYRRHRSSHSSRRPEDMPEDEFYNPRFGESSARRRPHPEDFDAPPSSYRHRGGPPEFGRRGPPPYAPTAPNARPLYPDEPATGRSPYYGPSPRMAQRPPPSPGFGMRSPGFGMRGPPPSPGFGMRGPPPFMSPQAGPMRRGPPPVGPYGPPRCEDLFEPFGHDEPLMGPGFPGLRRGPPPPLMMLPRGMRPRYAVGGGFPGPRFRF